MTTMLGNISKHYLCVELILIYFPTVYQNVYVRQIDVHHVHCIMLMITPVELELIAISQCTQRYACLCSQTSLYH